MQSRSQLAALASVQFLLMLSASVINVTSPAIGEDLRLSPVQLSWVVSAYVLAIAALLLPAGRATDLVGRRRLMLVGLCVFAAASVLAALSDSVGPLIGARALQGVGVALVEPALLSLFLLLAPPGERGKPLGLWGAAAAAGGGAGTLLGGLLTGSTGWQSVFFTAAALAVLLAVACARMLPADVRTAPGLSRQDMRAAIALSAGLVAVAFGSAEAGRTGWTRPAALASVGAGLVLLALLAAAERRRRYPLVPVRAIAKASVGLSQLAVAVMGMTGTATFFFLAQYQQRVLGDTPQTAALWQLPLTVAAALGSVLAARLARLVGPKMAAVLGQTALGAGLLWLGRLTGEGTFAQEALVPSLLVGCGMGLAVVHLTQAATAWATPQEAGLVSGLTSTARAFGGVIGLAPLSSLAAYTTVSTSHDVSQTQALQAGYSTAFTTLGLIMAASTLLLIARIPRPWSYARAVGA
ncbi:MFS transporter [Streptomyces sp. SCSIO 30461]|uniref:MFS transporter n=1 Tax=Streptomyces sp. SCSIO 30461 TaxID=3118085 RepID=UPI0030D0AFCC